MKVLVLRLSACLGIVLALAGAGSVYAQEDVAVPCDDTLTSRPTLKRQSLPSSDPVPATERVPCLPSQKPAKPKTVALKLEGTVKISVSDISRDLRDKQIDLPTDIADEPVFI